MVCRNDYNDYNGHMNWQCPKVNGFRVFGIHGGPGASLASRRVCFHVHPAEMLGMSHENDTTS